MLIMALIEYRADGILVPSPNRIIWGNQLISRSYDDAFAIFRDWLIRERWTCQWQYDALTKADFIILYNAVWVNKIRATGSRIFNITTEIPGESIKTCVMYLGTPTNFESLLSTKDKGTEFYKFNIDWIEKEGRELLGAFGVPD